MKIMANFYGYDPMEGLPQTGGFRSAAGKLGDTIQMAGSEVDKSMANRASKTALYAEATAFLNDPDLSDMPAKYKQSIPPPQSSDTEETYKAKITAHLKSAIGEYSKTSSDPNKLGRVASKVESSFKEVGSDPLAQRSLELRYGENRPEIMQQQQQNDVGTISNLGNKPLDTLSGFNAPGTPVTPPENDLAAPRQGESNEAFFGRQSAAFNADRQMARDPYEDIRPQLNAVLNDPLTDAKTKNQTIQQWFKWDIENKKESREKEAANERKEHDRLVQEFSDFLQKGGVAYDKNTNGKALNPNVAAPERYSWSRLEKQPTTIRYEGGGGRGGSGDPIQTSIDKNRALIQANLRQMNGMTATDEQKDELKRQNMIIEGKIIEQEARQRNKPIVPIPNNSTPPISKLKEGVNTTFGNGQVWTLKGGKATRIK